jgi:hypothetical protein
MSIKFTKLHSTIISSSIWNESDDVRIVFVTMLAMADENGVIRASVGGLAHQARKSKEDTERALTVLSSPDSDSTRKVEDGRRIIAIEGGWQLVNHGFYRELGMSEETKAYWREKQREHRQKSVEKNTCQGQSMTSQRPSASASSSDSEVVGGCGGKDAAGPDVEQLFESFYVAYPKHRGKREALEAFRCVVEKHGAGVAALIQEALKYQCESEEWLRDGGSYVPRPAKYLQDDGWLDTRAEVEAAEKRFDTL